MTFLYFSERGARRRALLAWLAAGAMAGVAALWIIGAIIGWRNAADAELDDVMGALEASRKAGGAELAAMARKLDALAERHAASGAAPTILAHLAQVQRRQGNALAEARVWLRLASAYPQSPYRFDAIVRAADLLEAAGATVEAGHALRGGIEVLEGSQRSVMELRLALWSYRHGDPDLTMGYIDGLLGAIESGDRLTWVNPALGRLHLLLARLFWETDRHDEAGRHLQMAREYCYDDALRRKITEFENTLSSAGP